MRAESVKLIFFLKKFSTGHLADKVIIMIGKEMFHQNCKFHHTQGKGSCFLLRGHIGHKVPNSLFLYMFSSLLLSQGSSGAVNVEAPPQLISDSAGEHASVNRNHNVWRVYQNCQFLFLGLDHISQTENILISFERLSRDNTN